MDHRYGCRASGCAARTPATARGRGSRCGGPARSARAGAPRRRSCRRRHAARWATARTSARARRCTSRRPRTGPAPFSGPRRRTAALPRPRPPRRAVRRTRARSAHRWGHYETKRSCSRRPHSSMARWPAGRSSARSRARRAEPAGSRRRTPLQAGGDQESQLAESEHDAAKAGLAQLTQRRLQLGCGSHVRLARGHHAHAIALGTHGDPERDTPFAAIDRLC